MEGNRKLTEMLKKVIGNKILKINAGENTGSIINIEIGRTLKIDKNSNVLGGDCSLMIYCSWRLSHNNRVITSWNESNNINGPMLTGLDAIAGRVIDNIELRNFFDLVIELEGNYVLNVFNDLSANQDLDTNWFFRDGINYYVINNHYQIVKS